MSRLQETLASTPLSTRTIMAICILTYIYQFLSDPPLHNFTMCPRNVLYLNEYYRFVTSALFHGSLMHIGMNMMSTLAIGSMLEKQLGSIMMGITILWGILLTSTVYVFISWVLHLVFGYEKMMLQHSLGFSGVIFQLSVLESNMSPNRARSVFGVFQVSSRMYPWALLVVLQFIMPQISFLGHLAGILVGTLQYYGVLDVLFPSETYLQEFEMSDRLEGLRRQPGYVMVPEMGFRRENRPDIRTAMLTGFGCIAVFMKNVCETIKVCIFGRGVDANANIQLSELGAAWGSSHDDAAVAANTTATGGAGAMIRGNVEDDEEWVGLPAAIHRSTEEMLEGLRRQPGYVMVPEMGFRRENRPDIRTAMLTGFGCIAVFMKNVCETIKVCIFGRGVDANANIQLSELGAAWGSSHDDAAVAANTTATGGAGAMIRGNVEDDEEWVGLPAAIHRSTEEM
ncbi:hypothetical protein ACHAXR_003836 [Thalassiosira sp. AJA248-18]